MREIKFRGRRLDNGEWIYGFYRQYPIYKSCGRCLDHINHFIDRDRESEFVDPTTVGQYTGCKDVTGREIYEYDIVEWENLRGTKTHSVIVFDGRAFVFACKDEYLSGKFDGGLWACKCRIIGNIHDNPELLKIA